MSARLAFPRFRACMVAAALAVAGCASGPPKTLRLDPAGAREMRTWPRAPEVPRYRLEGMLLGEQNYVGPEGATKPGWRSALEWIAGLGIQYYVGRHCQV